MWNEHDSTLLLQWDSNGPLKKKCAVYMVRILCNQKDTIQVRRYDIMTILHSFYQLSHLHLSFSPSRQTWQKCHTVSLRSHRTSTMFSKSGALLLMSVVLRISGVTGALQWSGAVQVGQWGTRERFALICRLIFSNRASLFSRGHRQTRLVAVVVWYSVSPSAVVAGFVFVLLWEVRDV